MTPELKKIIAEELTKYIEEQQADKIMRKNVDQHQKILVFLDRKLAEILKSDKPAEELQNMTNVVLKSDTPTFLSQILNVPDAEKLKDLLPSLVKSLKAINPAAVKQYSSLLQATRAIVEKGLTSARDKLGEGKEGDLPFLARDYQRKKKRKDKIKTPPKPNLGDVKLEEIFGIGGSKEPTDSPSALAAIKQMRIRANKLNQIYSARLDQGRNDAAAEAKAQLQNLVNQIGNLKKKFSIQEEAACSNEPKST